MRWGQVLQNLRILAQIGDFGVDRRVKYLCVRTWKTGPQQVGNKKAIEVVKIAGRCQDYNHPTSTRDEHVIGRPIGQKPSF